MPKQQMDSSIENVISSVTTTTTVKRGRGRPRSPGRSRSPGRPKCPGRPKSPGRGRGRGRPRKEESRPRSRSRGSSPASRIGTPPAAVSNKGRTTRSRTPTRRAAATTPNSNNSTSASETSSTSARGSSRRHEQYPNVQEISRNNSNSHNDGGTTSWSKIPNGVNKTPAATAMNRPKINTSIFENIQLTPSSRTRAKTAAAADDDNENRSNEAAAASMAPENGEEKELPIPASSIDQRSPLLSTTMKERLFYPQRKLQSIFANANNSKSATAKVLWITILAIAVLALIIACVAGYYYSKEAVHDYFIMAKYDIRKMISWKWGEDNDHDDGAEL